MFMKSQGFQGESTKEFSNNLQININKAAKMGLELKLRLQPTKEFFKLIMKFGILISHD